MKQILMCMLVFTACSPCTAAEKPAPYYGVNHDFVWTKDEEIPALIAAMKDARVQAVRIPIRWTMVEPQRGKWTWGKVDSVVRQIRAANIDILGLLMSVPPWASGIDPAKVEGFPDCYAPTDMNDWSEFVHRCTERYKAEIRCWEVWNEENGQDFYKPMPDAKVYVSILKAANEAIKNADPKATVVMGGLQMNGIIANPWSPVKVENFLQFIYDAGGRPYFDVVNIHPYVLATENEGPSYCAKLVRDTAEVMKKNGDAAKPLWITEVGVGTNDSVTREKQAEHLEGIYRDLGAIPQVKAIYWFTLRDYGKSICGGEDTMGMITFDGKRKPSFDAYRKLAGSAAPRQPKDQKE